MRTPESSPGSDGTEPPASGAPAENAKADLRDLGLWMRVMGWCEVLVGAAAGGLWALARLRVVPREAVDAAAPDWRSWHIPALAAVGFGVLTLRAAGSVRRAARAAEPLPPQVATLVERLKDLFEAQAILLLLALVLAVVSAL